MKSADVKATRFRQVASRFINGLFNDAALPWWPVIATLFVHFEVLSSGFLFDDFVHLYNLSNLPFRDAIHLSGGKHLLYSFTTVLWLIKSFFGANPFAFMLLGLIVHLASVRLLFEIISRLTGKGSLAAFGAALWGMSPYAIGTLGWLSVHGQAYATAAILWVLLDLVRCQKPLSVPGNSLLFRHALLLLLAATSFGTGLAAVMVFPFVVALWNPLPPQRTRLVAIYGSVALAVIALYMFSRIVQGAGDDTLGKVLSQGTYDLLKPSLAFAELLSIGFSGLIGGPLIVGKISLVPEDSLSSLAPRIALLIALPLLVLGNIATNANERRRMLALFLLPCAAYALIAYARSGGWFAIITDAPRYHYLAPAMMTVIVCLLLSNAIDRLPEKLLDYGRASFFVWLALVVLPFHLGPVSAVKEHQLLKQNRQYKESMQTIEAALAASEDPKTIYIANKPFNVYVWGYTPQHFPGLSALFVMNYPGNTVDGKRVYFLEESADIVQIAQARKGSRIAELVIQATDVNQ